MFNKIKRLADRVKSLEEFFALKYSTDEYPAHFKGDYGFIPHLDSRLEKIEKQLEELTKVKK